MGFRYCEECDRWLETADYTVDETGEKICPEHKAVVGFIVQPPVSEEWFRRENNFMRIGSKALAAAKRQGLVE